jgi:hypothetical protein
MDKEWGNPQRIGALFELIGRQHHDQMPVGMGFNLRHNPGSCIRCRANTALLELAAILRNYESQEEGVEEGVTIES